RGGIGDRAATIWLVTPDTGAVDVGRDGRVGGESRGQGAAGIAVAPPVVERVVGGGETAQVESRVIGPARSRRTGGDPIANGKVVDRAASQSRAADGGAA